MRMVKVRVGDAKVREREEMRTNFQISIRLT
jgi:hypothetical protein